MAFNLDEILNTRRDYDKSLEVKQGRQKKDKTEEKLKSIKNWFVCAINEHIKFVKNGKHIIEIGKKPLTPKQQKVVESITEIKYLWDEDSKKSKNRYCVLKLQYGASPSFIKFGNGNSSAFKIPEGLDESKEIELRTSLVNRFKEEIEAGLYDNQIRNFGKRESDEEREVRNQAAVLAAESLVSNAEKMTELADEALSKSDL